MTATAPQPVIALNTPLGESVKKPRLVSLDVFRGLTVMGMVLVNNPGSWSAQYWPLAHAHWDGLTPTDLVMPFFLFIVGVAIAYAMDSKRDDKASHPALILRIIRRTILLFLLAYLASLWPSYEGFQAIREKGFFSYYASRLENLRLMGVLARIAVVYLACSILFLKTSRRTVLYTTIALIVGYFLALQFIPVSGAWGRDTWQPGKDLGALIDRTVLRPQHLYKSKEGWDPEGLFSSLAAIASGLIGVLAGQSLKRTARPEEIPTCLVQLFSAGVALSLAGWLWHLWMPMNKQLWTPAFTLVTAGLALLSFAALYWVIDIRDSKWWTGPAVWFGVNAITVFVASGLLPKILNYIPVFYNDKRVGPIGYVNAAILRPNISSPELASLAWALIYVTFWIFVAWALYRLKWIFKV